MKHEHLIVKLCGYNTAHNIVNHKMLSSLNSINVFVLYD